MATLYNVDDSKSISIYLYKDIQTHKWIKYQIIFEKKNPLNPERVVFSEEIAEVDLFLESDIEPEITRLVEDILAFLNMQTYSFEFEPINEKEFSLSAGYIGGKIKVKLILQYRDYSRKITMFTDYKKLLLFANELQAEFDDLIKGRHALIKHSIF